MILGEKCKQHWAISLAIIVFVVLILVWNFISKNWLSDFFGGNDATPAKILTYIGVICGAIIVVGNLYASDKRNTLAEKGQLDTRFKDAATLLANESTSAILSGIYALHQIAEETSRDESQKGYVKVIHNILCAYVRENWRKPKEDSDEVKHKPPIILQTIIDILFKNKSYIYDELNSNLSHCFFSDIDFSESCINNVNFLNCTFIKGRFFNATINNVNFSDSTIDNVEFGNLFTKTTFNIVQFNNSIFKNNVLLMYSIFKNVEFKNSTMNNVFFNSAILEEVDFSKSKLDKIHFSDASLNDFHFDIEAKLNDVYFNGKAHLSEGSFSSSSLNNVAFSKAYLNNVNFNGSIVLGGIAFSEANLTNIDFSSVDLKNTNFSEAILNDVNFMGADLADTNFDGVQADEGTSYYYSFSKQNLEQLTRQQHIEVQEN